MNVVSYDVYGNYIAKILLNRISLNINTNRTYY